MLIKKIKEKVRKMRNYFVDLQKQEKSRHIPTFVVITNDLLLIHKPLMK